VKFDDDHDARLVAYVLPLDKGLNERVLRETLKATLPAYMIPSVFVEISRIPTTISGKIDYVALSKHLRSGTSNARGQTETERWLFGLVASVLKNDKFEVTDNLLDVGLASLDIVGLVTAIRGKRNFEVGVLDVFEHPTIQALAKYLDAHTPEEQPENEQKNWDHTSMRLLKSKLIVSCIIIYLTAASLSLYIPVLAPLILGGSNSILTAASSEARQLLYTAAVTAPQVFSAIGAPLCGALSDRYGRRRSLIAALSGAMAAMSLCAIAIVLQHAYLLVVGLALIGLMDGSGVIVQAGLLEETPPDQHASTLGKLTACSVVGLVSGPLIGGVCSDQRILPFSTYYLPFIVTSLLFALAVGIVLAYYSEGTRGAAQDRSESGRYLSDLIATITPPQIRRFACLFFLLKS